MSKDSMFSEITSDEVVVPLFFSLVYQNVLIDVPDLARYGPHNGHS